VDVEGRTGFVFAINDSGMVKKQKVDISGIYGNWAAITQGFSGGERIVTEGAAYLSDGDKIQIIK
jgi:multidrug efflux pump subunit AcrA (membrane-fusion protein)